MSQEGPDKAKIENDNNTEFTEVERSFLNLVAEIIVEIVMKDDEYRGKYTDLKTRVGVERTVVLII